MGPVLSHELCAIFVCIFNLYITVFMLQLYLSENYRNLPLFPWHILALRSEYSFHLCVCMFAHALVVFKTVSICLLQPQHPKSHLNGKLVHMCACVHTHAGGGDQASREAAYSRVRRPVLCTLPVRNLGSPHPQRRVILKPRLIVQYYLGGTVVALDISRLLTFLTAFHVIHPYQRESKKENVFYYSFLKENNMCESA